MSFNTPNMSYCAAENTKRAVDQLLELMHSGKKEDIEKGDSEYRAIRDLAQLGRDLADACDEFIEYVDDGK
jgi:hypothetical protein